MPNFNSPYENNMAPGYFDMPDIFGADEPPMGMGYNDAVTATAGMPSVDYGSLGLGSQGYRVPYDALSAMLGIEMPNIPDRDQQGRYGLTESQTTEADNRGMANAFFGAAQSFMGGGPAPAMQGAMQAGDIRRASLDKASLSNAQDYEMRMKNAIAQMELIKSRTAVEMNQAQVEEAYGKLDSAKQLRAIGDAFIEQMTPIANNYTAAAYKISEGFGQDVEMKFTQIAALTKKGDLAGADAMRNAVEMQFAAVDPTGKIAQQFDNDIKVATLKGLTEHKVDASIIKNILDSPEFQGYSYELGPDGKMSVLSPWEKEKRELGADLTRQQINTQSAYAQAAILRANAQAALKPTEIFKKVSAANAAVETLKQLGDKRPTDPKEGQKWDVLRSKALGALADAGLQPDDLGERERWRGMNQEAKMATVTGLYMSQLGVDPSMMAGGPSGGRYGQRAAPTTEGAVRGLFGAMGDPSNLTDEEAAAQVNTFLPRLNDQNLSVLLKAYAQRGGSPKQQLMNLYNEVYLPLLQQGNPNHPAQPAPAPAAPMGPVPGTPPGWPYISGS